MNAYALLKTKFRTFAFGNKYIDWQVFWDMPTSHVGGSGSSPGKDEDSMEVAARHVIDALELKSEDLLLDVGCGDGTFARRLPCRAEGVDFSEVIKRAVIPAMAGTLTNIPTKKVYPKVMVIGAWHYLKKKEVLPALTELHRVGEKVLIGFIPDRSYRDEILSTCPRADIPVWANVLFCDKLTLRRQAESVGFNAKILESPQTNMRRKSFSLLLTRA